MKRIEEERTQAIIQVPSTNGSSPVPLALPRRVPLKCNVKITSCSITQERDFSLLKDNSKRLLLLNHT